MTPLSLVLLPGMDGTGLFFGPLVAALPATIRPIVVRYPGDRPLTYDELLPIASAAIPTDGRFILLGESFSGPLAVMLASKRPAGLAGLILCASFVSPPRRWVGPAVRILARSPVFYSYVPYKRLGAKLLGLNSPEHLELFGELETLVKPSVLAARVRMAFDVDVRNALAMCPVPVLYIQAQRDLLVPQRNLRVVQRIGADVRIISLNSSHSVLQNQANAAAEAIAAFADSLVGGVVFG